MFEFNNLDRSQRATEVLIQCLEVFSSLGGIFTKNKFRLTLCILARAGVPAPSLNAILSIVIKAFLSKPQMSTSWCGYTGNVNIWKP